MWLQKDTPKKTQEKPLKKNQKKTLKLFFILFALCSASCSPKNTLNSAFQKKYGKEVKKIADSRVPPKTSQKKDDKLDFASPQDEYMKQQSPISSDYEQYYASVDPDEYASTPPRNFLPNGEVYEQAKSAPESLPKNIFNISYRTALSPAFRKSGVDFDLINIPPQDSYGVITAMSEKEYFLVGNNSLQKNIDYINKSRSSEDVEMSKILIKEQRQLRRKQKTIKAFGVGSIKEKTVKEKVAIVKDSKKPEDTNKASSQQLSDKSLEEKSKSISQTAQEPEKIIKSK